MNTYNLHYASDNSVDQIPGMGRSLLQVYTGDSISETEAEKLLRRIADHKWHISEKLNRDVGFHVAAIDYVENFYEPIATTEPQVFSFVANAAKTIRSAIKQYLIAKGGTMPV